MVFRGEVVMFLYILSFEVYAKGKYSLLIKKWQSYLIRIAFNGIIKPTLF